MPPRFLQVADIAEMLSISARQAYALVKSGELPAIRVGGRGQWRVEVTELEAYIQRKYAETRAMVAAHPAADADLDESDVDEPDADESADEPDADEASQDGQPRHPRAQDSAERFEA